MYMYLANEFSNLNKVVPNIHYGGCCLFAEEVFTLLKKLKKKPRVIILTTTPKTVKHYVKYFPKVSETITDIGHAVIYVDGVFIDNNGIYNKLTDVLHYENEKRYKRLRISKKELSFINENMENWNPRFEREKLSVVKNTLKNIENYLVSSK